MLIRTMLLVLAGALALGGCGGDAEPRAAADRQRALDVLSDAVPLLEERAGLALDGFRGGFTGCAMGDLHHYNGGAFLTAAGSAQPDDGAPGSRVAAALQEALADAGFDVSAPADEPDFTAVRDGVSLHVRPQPGASPAGWALTFETACEPYSEADREVAADTPDDGPDALR